MSQARRQQQNWLSRCCPCFNSKYSSKRSLRTSSSTHTTLSSSTVHHSQVPKGTVYSSQVQNSSSISGTEMLVIFWNSTSSPLLGTERPITLTTEQSSTVYITHGTLNFVSQVKYGVRSPKFILGSMCSAQLFSLAETPPPPPPPSPRIWAHIRGRYWSAKTSLCDPLLVHILRVWHS